MSMMPLTAAFVISNRTVWEQAHACMQNLPVRLAVEQGMGRRPAEADALLDRIERHRVDVVLVEASRVAMPLEEFVRRLKNTAAQPAVFVLQSGGVAGTDPGSLARGRQRISLSASGRYAARRIRKTLRGPLQRRHRAPPTRWERSSAFFPRAADAAPPLSRFMWPPTSRDRQDRSSRCCWPISISKPDCSAS